MDTLNKTPNTNAPDESNQKRNHTINQKLVLLVLAVVLAIGSLGAVYTITRSDTTPQPTTSKTTSIPPVTKLTVTDDGKTVNYNAVAGETALATLQSLAQVDTQSSNFGTMVVGINGVAADNNTNYWAFYINDTYGTEGAGTYVAQAGDRITWKLEAITR